MENGAFKNRIVGHGVKPASQFQANPLNWRQHPQEQRQLINSVLNEIGWVQNVVENISTGHLIDGHERVWQGLQNGDAEIPYIQVDLSPDEEKTMLALLDPISAMAYTDRENLKELLEGITAMDANITKFLSEMAEREEIIPSSEIFDPSKLPDVFSGPEKSAFLIYITFEDYENFKNTVECLTHGKRKVPNEKTSNVVIDSKDYESFWRDKLNGT